MEDKMFELITQIYSELKEFRNETGKRLDNLEEGQNKLNSDIVRLENKLDDNSKALFDGYKQTYEEVKEVKKSVEELSSKVEKQEVEIKSLKNGY